MGIQQAFFMLGTSLPPVTPGQFEFYSGSASNPLDVSTTIPAGVTSICACIVSPDGGPSVTLKVNGVVVMSVNGASRSGCDGGGNGGVGGGSMGGGGGAGGYSGAGGDGGLYQTTGAISPGTTGAGGGGGGGGGGHIGVHPQPNQTGGSGGGVGLKGTGTNGAGGNGADYLTPATNGSPGSGGFAFDGLFGGGGLYTGSFAGVNGGGLGWANNIPVAPGDTIRVEAPLNFYGLCNGGGRILWGGARSYPSNAGDM